MAQQRRNGNGGDKKEATKPVWSRRYWTGSGSLEVAVWEREIGKGDDARLVMNTTLKKTYKEKDSDEYKESSSFRPEELGLVCLAMQEAFRFISEENHRE